jgi:hypothetical protein
MWLLFELLKDFAWLNLRQGYPTLPGGKLRG